MVLKRKTARVAAITWVLIFGGMLMLAVGLVVGRTEPELGGWISALSGLAVGIGVLLVWLRSRMKEGES